MTDPFAVHAPPPDQLPTVFGRAINCSCLRAHKFAAVKRGLLEALFILGALIADSGTGSGTGSPERLSKDG